MVLVIVIVLICILDWKTKVSTNRHITCLFVRLFVGLLFGFFLRFLGRLGRAITGPAIQLPYLLCHSGVRPGNATRLVVCLAVFGQHVCLINMYLHSTLFVPDLFWKTIPVHSYIQYGCIETTIYTETMITSLWFACRVVLLSNLLNPLRCQEAIQWLGRTCWGISFLVSRGLWKPHEVFFWDEHEKSMQLLWPKVWPGCLTNLSIIPYNLCSHLLLSHVVQGQRRFATKKRPVQLHTAWQLHKNNVYGPHWITCDWNGCFHIWFTMNCCMICRPRSCFQCCRSSEGFHRKQTSRTTCFECWCVFGCKYLFMTEYNYCIYIYNV